MRFTGIAALLLIITLHQASQAYTDAVVDTFFQSISSTLSTDYHRCTGDTATVSTDSLLKWKKAVNARVDSISFQKIRKEFMAATGRKNDFSPCDVLVWNDERLTGQRELETGISTRIHAEDDADVDSVLYRQEIDANAPGWSDYAGIPFGISRTAFRICFEQRVQQPLFEKQDAFYQEQVPIAGEPFLVSFFFNRQGRYCAYRIESYDLPGKEFDGRVREQSKALIRYFASMTGHPGSTERFSIMEIHPDTLAVQARWIGSPITAEAGILLTGSRYRAQLLVNHERLSDRSEPVRKKK